ncbi:CcdB family protein [Spirochaeta isovalerica]|uniref:Toxin CcdB n=1 Tax=Spirochaeta isovalerica TaxID=150 RepID=A0A841R7H6_9SPIO|nr:CcdB family protein [Spirochaeta isovalerica]MBB6479803.1 toxin CcdB [Spirochaeta isovalerica]
MQFHLYTNKGKSSGETPLLLDLQTPFLSDLATRIVAPVRKKTKTEAILISKIHIPFILDNQEYTAYISEMAAVPVKYLGEEKGSLESLRTELIAAVDLIFTGF